jgi:putative transposase
MTDYRRFHIPGSTWFFTVNLAERRGNPLLVEQIGLLREAFRYVKRRKLFRMEAVVIMPDHLHCIWTLPPGDADFSTRWGLLKGHFSRALPTGERASQSRAKRRERGIWQRRFWAHLLTDQDDFNAHFDLYSLESRQTWVDTESNRLAAFEFPSVCGIGRLPH